MPKSKIYSRGRANTRLKDLFVTQLEQIVWQFKLAPETINVPACTGVPEIQVFGLQLKTTELHPDVLRAIDSAVQYPILFELSYKERVQEVACYKRPSDAEAGKWVLSGYHSGPWQAADAHRDPMPVALDLGRLYEQLLHRLMPLAPRPGETLAALSDRLAQAKVKERDVERIAAQLRREIQFKRKVELNATLRQLKAELEELSQPWTN